MTNDDDALSEELGRIYDEIKAYFDELVGESPRAAAILAVASLEDELDALLRSKFPHTISNPTWKRIAGPGPTPFGNLKAKTDVAEAFGFFGPQTRATINRIASVRNKFAHRTSIRDFDHPDVLAICRELADNPVFPHTYIANPQARDIRWHFINTVKALTNHLANIRGLIPELDGDPPKPLP